MASVGTRFNGSTLRALRDARGWSQSELGRRIGAHTTSVSDWERGDNAPSGRHVVGLAHAFEVSADTFYVDPDDAESARMAAGGPLSDEDYAMYGRLTARIVAYQARP